MDEWYANPVVWTLVGLAIVAAAGRFWYWRGQVDSDRDKFKNFMTEIGRKIDRIQEKTDRIQAKTDKIQAKTDRIQEKTDRIQENVHELMGVTRNVSKPGSPLTLTELGNKVAKCLESNDIFKNMEPIPSDQIHGKQPYEIHDICFDYVHDKLQPSSEMEVAIRSCAYENGVKYGDVLEVMAIVLRDRLLQNHEE